MLLLMKQLLIEVDDELARQLEGVAPAKSRRRSEFVRQALRQAIWALQEQATAEAYARQTDTTEPAYFDPGTWESVPPRKRRPRKR